MLASQPPVARELVVVLGVGAEVAGQGAEVADVPVLGDLGLRAVQPADPELADRIEQPVARTLLFRAQHHRLVHQADQGGQDVLGGQRPAGADRLGGRDVERPGEHRQPCPQPLLRGRAEVVTPPGGGVQRLLVRRHRPAVTGERAEAAFQAAAQLAERERAQLHGSELDGQRDPVQAPAQPDDVVPVAGGDGEARRGRRGPLGEQLHRVPAPAPAGLRSGDGQRRHRVAVLTQHVHRLPAGGQHGHPGRVAQQQADEVGAGADQVLTGIEDEQELTTLQVVHDRIRLAPGILLRQPEAARDGVRQQAGIVQAAQLGQERAIGEPAAGTGGGPQREPRLADTAGAGHGHQPGRDQQPVQHGQLPPAADEPGDLTGQLTGNRPDQATCHAALTRTYRTATVSRAQKGRT